MINPTTPFLVIYGPTGVGKTAFVDSLALKIPCEIINMDSGQFYLPLSIGTAKPAWQSAPVSHHLFDSISTPHLPTVVEYRKQVSSLLVEITRRGNLPVLVGGSGFYLKSLLFPPLHTGFEQKNYVTVTSDNALHWWQELKQIDPMRAAEINPHDTYRIQRALDIWYASGIKPSELKPIYNPPAPYHIIYLTRDKSDLRQRIADRTQEMFAMGWVDEVRALSKEWVEWIKDKKIIGYTEVIAYLEGSLTYQEMIHAVITKTIQYAKRQDTFWRMLKKEILVVEDSYKFTELNLTTVDIHLYIMKLSKSLGDLFI